MNKKAFSLVELMIVVAILGILASIVLPKLHGHTVQTKEAAIQDTLRTVRSQIELYKMHHKGLVPGYSTLPMTSATLKWQFEGCTDINGDVNYSKTPSGACIYGPYVNKIAENPFNGKDIITIIDAADTFQDRTDDSSGWLYKKETAEFKPNIQGTDSMGINFYDY